jgi:hypothetical protein
MTLHVIISFYFDNLLIGSSPLTQWSIGVMGNLIGFSK